MTHRLHRAAALLSIAVITAAVAPTVAAATAHRRTTAPTAPVQARRATVPPKRLVLGTVKGRIKAAHHLKGVDIVVYERTTAQDGSKGWVLTDYQFASGGYGLDLDKKTGDYSFKVRPGTYRLEFNGAYQSGHKWGIVAYGPGKPAAAAFGASVKVRKGKVTKRINVTAAGGLADLGLPDPQPSMSPGAPTAGGAESVVLGTWPRGTKLTYTWQIGNSEKYLSFKRTVTVPSSAANKSLSLDVYGHAYGKNGSSVAISTTVTK